MAESRTSRWLARSSTPVFMAWAISAAFATYFCMYAYRKAWAVGKYAGTIDVWLLGAVDAKIVFIIAQVIGYCLSKFVGIKVVSEMPRERRAFAILLAIGVAELALVLFALLPPGAAALAMFFNGLPLGMIWGLVFGFLEGRKTSDGLGAGLCASFILASGVVKSVGAWTMQLGVSEAWMPALTGLWFLPPMVLFVWMLAQLPPPTKDDEVERLRREPMDGRARWRFFLSVAPGLVLLTAAYVLLTAYRDFRDNFAREIWDALGYVGEPAILTTAEIPVAFGSLVVVAGCMAIKNNRTALLSIHAAMLVGAVLIGGSTLAFDAGMLSPAAWMIAVGLGLYIGYVPYNCVLFDRMLPALGHVGTAGFLIYVTDAFGYLGSVGLLLYKNFGRPNLSWLNFFRGFSQITAWTAIAMFVVSAAYFARRTKLANVTSA